MGHCEEYINYILRDTLREFIEWLLQAPKMDLKFTDEVIERYLEERNRVTKEGPL